MSGGEEGARHGPSIMPGGSPTPGRTWRESSQPIAAKVDDGVACCDWVGADGAGHYVKMVHNGIEYGDMQLIAEAYHLLREGSGFPRRDGRDVFAEWNRGPLDRYLIEITADILASRPGRRAARRPVLDAAGQKGTGKWTAISSPRPGPAGDLVAEAVFARDLGAEGRAGRGRRGARRAGARITGGDGASWTTSATPSTPPRSARYAQGFMLIGPPTTSTAGISTRRDRADVARRVHHPRRVPREITEAFDRDPELANLLLDPYFAGQVDAARTLAPGRRGRGRAGIPAPAFATALAYYDGYRTALPATCPGPARLLRRPHLRAHRPAAGRFFHTDWTEDGAPEVPVP